MNPGMDVVERSAVTAKHAGVSIFITSLTDWLAFFIGAMGTSYPALSWFCNYCAWSIFFCFIFQLTMVLPMMVLNAKRTDGLGCCSCCGGCTKMPKAIGCCD